MRIPRYDLYWRASGLSAISRKYRVPAGAALLLLGPGLVHLADLGNPWRALGFIATVIAGIGLICSSD